MEAQDRISLITFAKNARIIFSLVEKERNFTQLRNQIDRMELTTNSHSNLYKAMVEAVKEFSDTLVPGSPRSSSDAVKKNDAGHISENTRYIICFSSS